MICPVTCLPAFAWKALELLLVAFVIALAVRVAVFITWNKAFGFRWYGGVFMLMLVEWVIGIAAGVLLIIAGVWIFGLHSNPVMQDLYAVIQCVLRSLHACPS